MDFANLFYSSIVYNIGSAMAWVIVLSPKAPNIKSGTRVCIVATLVTLGTILHEFGHATTVLFFGYRVVSIASTVGGMAVRMFPAPYLVPGDDAMVISAAGPIISLFLAILVALLLKRVSDTDERTILIWWFVMEAGKFTSLLIVFSGDGNNFMHGLYRAFAVPLEVGFLLQTSVLIITVAFIIKTISNNIDAKQSYFVKWARKELK